MGRSWCIPLPSSRHSSMERETGNSTVSCIDSALKRQVLKARTARQLCARSLVTYCRFQGTSAFECLSRSQMHTAQRTAASATRITRPPYCCPHPQPFLRGYDRRTTGREQDRRPNRMIRTGGQAVSVRDATPRCRAAGRVRGYCSAGMATVKASSVTWSVAGSAAAADRGQGPAIAGTRGQRTPGPLCRSPACVPGHLQANSQP
jgi:hypothetical protein